MTVNPIYHINDTDIQVTLADSLTIYHFPVGLMSCVENNLKYLENVFDTS